MILRELLAKFGLDFDEKSFKKADSAINDLKTSATRLVEAFAVLEIGRKLTGIVEGTIEAARSVGGMAAKIGIGTDALQELQYAAQQSGIDVDDFNKSLTLMTHQLGAAANGDDGAIKKFAELGISIHDANGKVKDADVVLENIADKMKGAGSQAQRLAIAADFFGIRSGTRFAVALKNGAKGLQDLRMEARELGGVMSEDMIVQARETHHVMQKLDFALQGVKNTIVAALLPTIDDVVTSSLVWFRANREFIKSRLDFYVRRVADAAKTAGRWIFDAGHALVAIVGIVGGVENAFTILAIAIGVNLLAAIGEAVLGFGTLNFAMLATRAAVIADAVLMGAAFIALIAVIALVGEEIESLFDDKKQGLFESMSGKWGELEDRLIDTAANSQSAWGSILGFVGSVIAGVLENIDSFFDDIFQIQTKANDLVREFFELFDPRTNLALKNAIGLFDRFGAFSRDLDRSAAGAFSPGSFMNSILGGGSVSPSPAVAASVANGGATIANNVSVHVDASGQSLDEAQVADLVSRHVDNAMTNANANALAALTPGVSQ